MTGFWKEMEQGVNCIRLLEQILEEERFLLRHLMEKGKPTNHVEYRIARIEYALGETSARPDRSDYFPTQDTYSE